MKKYLSFLFLLFSCSVVSDTVTIPSYTPAPFQWRTQFYAVDMNYYNSNQDFRNNINNAADAFTCSGGETVFIGVDPGYNQYGFYCDHGSYCAADEDLISVTNIGPPKTVQSVCKKRSSSSVSSSSSSVDCQITESCGSSSSSASSCVSGFILSNINGNATCVPDLNPSSSSASSAAASSASSSAASSSASSVFVSSGSSSSTSGGVDSGGSGGSAGSGDSGSNSSSGTNPAVTAMQNCELIFGAGKCSVQTTQNACPNSYTSGGVVFCVVTGSASSVASGGGSGSGSSGAASSAASSAGQCDPTSKDYLSCIGPQKSNYASHTVTDSGATSVEQVNTNFRNRLNNSPVVSSFSRVKTVVSLSASQCPPFTMELFNRTISTTIHCSLWQIMGAVLSPIMLAIWTLIAFRIFASA